MAAATVIGSRLGVGFAVRAKMETLRWILFVTVIVVTIAAFLKT